MSIKILRPHFIAIIYFAIVMYTQTGCTNYNLQNNNNYPIEGLWEGTYTVGEEMPVPSGTSFYFSFSIYPNGKVSYKSKGFFNGRRDYITFADGTWTLEDGVDFNFSVTTVNLPWGGPHQLQEGHATFNSSDGTLTKGTFTVGSTVWEMKKVK